MKRILVISFSDVDVDRALTNLVKLNPEHSLVIPVTENRLFVTSAIAVAEKLKRPYHLFFSEMDDFTSLLVSNATESTVASNPVREAMREITPDDIFAIAWDESIEAHMALHSVEDFGVETWNIEGELEPITIASGDSDDLYEEMQEALSTFIEVFAAYLAAEVIEVIGKTVEQTLLDHIKDNIDPFDQE